MEIHKIYKHLFSAQPQPLKNGISVMLPSCFLSVQLLLEKTSSAQIQQPFLHQNSGWLEWRYHLPSPPRTVLGALATQL